jgi:hypothetical protein
MMLVFVRGHEAMAHGVCCVMTLQLMEMDWLVGVRSLGRTGQGSISCFLCCVHLATPPPPLSLSLSLSLSPPPLPRLALPAHPVTRTPAIRPRPCFPAHQQHLGIVGPP